MGFWKTFSACLLAIIVGAIVSALFSFMVLVGFVTLVGASIAGEQKVTSVSTNSVLYIDMGVEMSDQAFVDPLKSVDFINMEFKKSFSLNSAVARIKAAAVDNRIDGIFLEFPAYSELNLDALYQLREALLVFKESQKFIIAYSDTYSQGGYYLASVADKIYMNPQGGLDWKGMGMSVMMYKGLLDKIGVKPEVFRHGKFKGAVEPFLYDEISAENREQLTSMSGSIWGNIVEGISQSRGIDVDSLQSYANRLAVRSPLDAQRLGFVDSLAYVGNVKDRLDELCGKGFDANLVSITDYHYSVSTYSSNKIAVLYAVGDIIDGKGAKDAIASGDIVKEIDKLADDDNVKAVVLRVNSPGGSALASEVILQELLRLKAKKPLVVSMGDYAASGGYYISCFGDKIVADPSTITGSIGVFGLLFDLQKGTKDILGVNVSIVNTNTSSDLGNFFRPIRDAERAYIQSGVEQVYDRFISLVAQGRKLKVEYVDSIAQGRVWSGKQGVELGLVDQLGTLDDAVAVAAELAGVADYRVSLYPKPEEGSLGLIFQDAFGVAVKLVGLADDPQRVFTNQLKELSKKQGVLTRLPGELVFE